jgi:hypothetical protein
MSDNDMIMHFCSETFHGKNGNYKNITAFYFFLFFFFPELKKMPPTTPSRRNEIIDWYKSIPSTTRFLLSTMVITTTASSLGFISPSSLILYWPDVKYRLQVNTEHLQ